jgi:hypothetical protein
MPVKRMDSIGIVLEDLDADSYRARARNYYVARGA